MDALYRDRSAALGRARFVSLKGADRQLLVAVGLMIVANVLFAFNDVWLRRIADDIGLVTTLWGRSVLFLALMSMLMTRTDWQHVLGMSRPHLQIARAVLPLLGSFLMIGAMAHLPVADVTATFFISPLIAVLLAIALLHEKIGIEKWLALACGIAGVLVILRPAGDAFGWTHTWPLLAALTIALYQVFTTLVTRRANARVTLFFMAATATVITSVLVPFTWTTPSGGAWTMLFGTAVLYIVGHGMYIMAHAKAEASRLAPFVYFQLLGSVGAGYLLYGQVPGAYTLVGCALIALGGVLVMTRRKPPAAAVIKF